jgi:hypothetical protein
MERHWNQHIGGHRLSLQVLGQQLPQGSGQCLEVPVLEMVNSLAYDALEGEWRADAIDLQLPPPAIGTEVSFSQRLAACRADRRGQSG